MDKREWLKRVSGVFGKLVEAIRNRLVKRNGQSNGAVSEDKTTKLISKRFKIMARVEGLTESLQRQSSAFWGRLVTVLLCTYFLADLSALLIDKLIPEPPAAKPLKLGGAVRKVRTMDDYSPIFARNLFSSQGLIPGDDAPTKTQGIIDTISPPIKTSLPFNLIGTLILRDELRSIATIEDKSASTVYPVRVEDEIPSKAKILKIEARKVIFLNVSSNRREFIDMPDDTGGTNPKITLGGPKGGGKVTGVEQVAPTQFNVSRSEVDKSLSNLNEVLTQARCVPNFENGLPSGYKCFQIVPGSIYDKLGMVNGDTITGINGQSISDPGQAFQMLSELKTSNHIELSIKRDGKSMTMAYDIR